MKFSERIGLIPVKSVIQKNSMDDALRNSLWNALQLLYWNSMKCNPWENAARLSAPGNEKMRALFNFLWIDFFKQPLDTLDDHWPTLINKLRKMFFSCPWNQVYDFIEFVAQNHPHYELNQQFTVFCNTVLEREMSGYRFVGREIASITSEEEIGAINDALKSKISPVKEHLNCALEKLSDRKNPDYRNSIKESISAVEALVQKVTKSNKGTLGQLLKIMESKKGLHPALKDSFDKLYGYTSNADGIRHALLDEDTVTFEQAKFMLVVCSGFINYVTSTLKEEL